MCSAGPQSTIHSPHTSIRAVFLDRDGVLIENVPTYVRDWSQVEVFPGSLAACQRLCEAGYRLVMVTNQSGVGRGIVAREAVDAVNARLLAELGIDVAYVCPHSPHEGCDCRKPLPGMLHRAAQEHGIDLAASWMVGDAGSDMAAAAAAGARGVMVRTGRGREQEATLETIDWPVVDDLTAAVDRILAQ